LLGTTALGHDPASRGGGGERAIEFPDTAEHRTLVVDLHTHSVFSDGHVWPRIRVGEALRDGLDALAITEHLEWQPHLADIPHPDRNRSYEEALASVPAGSDLIVIAGSEITRSAPVGHMNAVFVNDANALLEVGPPPEPFDVREYYRQAGAWPAQAAVDVANEQGAFVFWNHSWSTFEDLRTELVEFHRANAAAGKLHGIEVVNGRTYSEESFQAALDHDLALVGVSDVHNLIDWDYEPHKGGHRPVNLVFAEGKTSEAIRQALLEKRTAIWYKNLLIGRSRELEPLLEASLKVSRARYPGDAAVLVVELVNYSDAHFRLRSLSEHSLISNYEIVEVEPHGMIRLRMRTGEKLESVTLDFEVLNALIAPRSHPTISYELTLD
jgi:hypothetical protein